MDFTTFYRVTNMLKETGKQRILSLAAALFFLCAEQGAAQSLINEGSINNTGAIRVRHKVLHLPDTLGGVFEYFGANQDVPGSRYTNLLLSGSGEKRNVGGSIAVTQLLTILEPVTLRIQAGTKLTLLGTMNEAGYVTGIITKSEDLSDSLFSSSFGNIGVTLSWVGRQPGMTTVIRTAGTVLKGNGNHSIARYYDIRPAVESPLNCTLVFHYRDAELHGRDPRTLELWRSPDGGATWRRQGGTVDTTRRTITRNGVRSLQLWSASDIAQPLGPPHFEWSPSHFTATSPDSLVGGVGTSVGPLAVAVTDAFGNPIPGVRVSFVISQVPAGATGQSLSTVEAITDENGQASTVLLLGNTVGLYRVSVTAAGLGGDPVVFTATAIHGSAASITRVSGDQQSAPIGTMLEPFVILIADATGNPVSGIPVTFGIASSPEGASGQSLTHTTMSTNALGQASTVLTLGSKVGTYQISVTSAGPSGSPLTFTSSATCGVPTVLAALSGDNQIKDAGATLDQPFVVRVLDQGGNPVPNVRMRFAITSVPPAAQGQRLSTDEAETNAQGEAASILTLGNRQGLYTVSAAVDSLPPVSFRAWASLHVGDVNGDGEVNIADLTTVINHLLARVTLSGSDSVKADIDQNGSIDQRDVLAMRRYLLEESTSSPPDTGNTPGVPEAEAELEGTRYGIRFSMRNAVPVNGLQIVLTLRNGIAAATDSIEIVYGRGQTMTIPVSIAGREVRAIAYNMDNTPIRPGTGPIFRFRHNVLDMSEIEQMCLLISTGETIHQAARGRITMVTRPTVPFAYVLEQNFPNPFNPATTIQFGVPEMEAGFAELSIVIYDQLGQQLRTLTQGIYEAGQHRVVWDGTNDAGVRVASGTYYYRLMTRDFQTAKKMIMLR